MDIKSVNTAQLSVMERPIHNVKNCVYSDDLKFYKLLAPYGLYNRTSLAYYVMVGLDFVWQGDNALAIDTCGLITKDVVPAFDEFIYDQGTCVGYTTLRGVPLTELAMTESLKLQYLKYITKLANHSIQTGWAYVSLNPNNIVMINGQLSLIDLDFSPIKLHHNSTFTPREQILWQNEFRSFDGVYLNMILNRLK